MSIFPITSLVREVQRLISATFDVSEQEAQDYAAELVSLAEGWGSPETAANWIGTIGLEKIWVRAKNSNGVQRMTVPSLRP